MPIKSTFRRSAKAPNWLVALSNRQANAPTRLTDRAAADQGSWLCPDVYLFRAIRASGLAIDGSEARSKEPPKRLGTAPLQTGAVQPRRLSAGEA